MFKVYEINWLYNTRWLKVPYQTKDGTMIERDMGVPQGGLCIVMHKINYAV